MFVFSYGERVLCFMPGRERASQPLVKLKKTVENTQTNAQRVMDTYIHEVNTAKICSSLCGRYYRTRNRTVAELVRPVQADTGLVDKHWDVDNVMVHNRVHADGGLNDLVKPFESRPESWTCWRRAPPTRFRSRRRGSSDTTCS